MGRSRTETWISVDVETSGPTPSTGSLLSLGACLVEAPEQGFYAELRPETERAWSEEAERIHRLSREHLATNGRTNEEAMAAFAAWVAEMTPGGSRALFVGFNATFDWMWVADAFARAGIVNPFGVSGLDLKAFYLGRHWPEVASWGETAKREVRRRYPTPPGVAHTHNALDDAREQAELARALRRSPA